MLFLILQKHLQIIRMSNDTRNVTELFCLGFITDLRHKRLFLNLMEMTLVIFLIHIYIFCSSLPLFLLHLDVRFGRRSLTIVVRLVLSSHLDTVISK